MPSIQLVRKATGPSRTDQVWSGIVTEDGKVRITYGPLGRSQRTLDVPPRRFTQFNAELELEHRATRKRSEGFVDTIDSVDGPCVAASESSPDDDWPTVYTTPCADLKLGDKEAVRLEREIAAKVEDAFTVSIPPRWPHSARMVSSQSNWRLPMLIYVLALGQKGLIDLYSDDEQRIAPPSIAKQAGLAASDERAAKLIDHFGLVTVADAFDLAGSLATCDAGSEVESGWFF